MPPPLRSAVRTRTTPAGQTAAFVVDNGVDSWLLYFESSGSDALVSAAELSIAGRLRHGVDVQVGDIAWGP